MFGRGKQEHSYDAIVIGSGISSGWAAKELCEGGIKTLVLERGRSVTHVKDYPTAVLAPWDFKFRGELSQHEKAQNPIADPNTSLLNAWNQLHLCNNVYVTDGACMTSVGNQNPSLAFMALTARAANHAVNQWKKGNFGKYNKLGSTSSNQED